MNRRRALLSLFGLSAAALTGCNQMSFMPQPRKRVLAGYEAVQNGMTETQVRQHLGDPVRRRRINLEGTARPAVAMTFLRHERIITVVLENGAVIAKQRA